MCGIVGVASAKALPRFPSDRVRDTMRHRGPDSAGSWTSTDGRVWLGHRRLAIIDLSADADQPMSDHAGELRVVFNGEIYNHAELREQLRASGHTFRTSSDTEVLLEAYRMWGPSCLDHLNGMFAFAIHDARTDTVFLARDRAGEKPLFYCHNGGRIVFASELKALLEDHLMPRRIDVQALNQYLAYGYVPGDGCILQGVRKLRQGEAMLYEMGRDRLTRWRYWQLPVADGDRPGALADLEERLEELLREAVRLRLRADVPVGVLLSGGIDSSLITAVAAEAASEPVRTFTVSFPGYGKFDEGPHARIVANHFGTKHTELEAEASDVELLPRLARQFDEPIADSSMLPTFLVSTLIRDHATVALGGDGGDELFGGYPHYSWLQRRAQVRRLLPAPVRRAASSGARVLPLGFKGRNYLLGLGAGNADSVAYVNLYFDSGHRRRLVPALARLDHAALHMPESAKGAVAQRQGGLDQATATDFMTYLVDDILVKVDRTSMLASLEVRSPWLDPPLVEFAFSQVPSELKATTREQKILPRRLARRLLPPTLQLERKQGFSLPLESWFAGRWGDYVRSVLLDGDDSTFDGKEVSRLFELQRRGIPNAQRLFALAIFELWRRHYRAELPA